MPFALFGPRSVASLRPSKADRLRLCGKIARELELGFDDLRQLPSEFQVADASCFVAGIAGAAVRLAGLLAHAQAQPHPLFVNAGTRDGAVRIAVFRQHVEPLGLVVYARDGRPLPAEEGGPFRLVLPGYHDGAGDLRDLGWIEVARSQGPDNRAALAHRASVVIGQQTFDAAEVWRDPRRSDTFVVPPPNG